MRMLTRYERGLLETAMRDVDPWARQVLRRLLALNDDAWKRLRVIHREEKRGNVRLFSREAINALRLTMAYWATNGGRRSR